ncbi:MAG: GntR family transcriptional regulator [Chloroflexi bacterium]|nr:GntR family transcriptional regulator [Chloroflexota bacterium]
MVVQQIKLSLDFRSGVPIYLQIMEQIRQKVASGELPQGDQLPTVRQLATDLRVNFNTVARAYRLLDQAGLISTQHGRGTYIWEAPSSETLDQLRQQSLDGLTRRYMNEAARLGAKPENISKLVNEYIKQWLDTGQPPTPDFD